MNTMSAMTTVVHICRIFLAFAKCVALLVLLHAQLSSGEYEIPHEALPTSSGYLHINTSTGSSLFYAYYEALDSPQELSKTPVLLWLQGGPGCSGLIGNFGELGPWRVEEDLQLHKNTAPWNRLFGLLFIDSPAGTGFSIPPSPDAITTDQHHVARDLYKTLEIFFNNPAYRSRPLYVTGESYGGKYVPALGYYIMNEVASNQRIRLTSQPPFELKGVAIGNGLTHPIVQVETYGPTAFYMGLVDQDQQLEMDQLAKKSVECIKKEDWLGAVAARSKLLSLLRDFSGLVTLEDVRKSVDYFTVNGSNYLTEFVNLAAVKKALGAEPNITWTQCNDLVDEKMLVDIMKSTKWMVEALIPQLPVLLYQGQFDIQDGVASSEAWMRNILWEHTPSFWASKRRVWKEEGLLAGYIRTHKTLSHVVVAGAGHLAPTDQNLRTQRMIEAWVTGKLGSL